MIRRNFLTLGTAFILGGTSSLFAEVKKKAGIFNSPHPNPDHVRGATYDPVRRTVEVPVDVRVNEHVLVTHELTVDKVRKAEREGYHIVTDDYGRAFEIGDKTGENLTAWTFVRYYALDKNMTLLERHEHLLGIAEILYSGGIKPWFSRTGWNRGKL